MTELLLAAVLFLFLHALSSTPLRAMVVGLTGEMAFKGIFSVLSIMAIVWLAHAYNTAPTGDILWSVGTWGRHVAAVVVALAVFFVVAGMTLANPTAAGFEGALESDEPARGILRVTRHPVMWGFVLWGLAHLLNNGDLKSVIFFGTFTLLALVGTRLIDAKRMRAFGQIWQNYVEKTSNLPFLAILQGRNRFVWQEVGIWRLVAAALVFAALLLGHEALFGVSPAPIH